METIFLRGIVSQLQNYDICQMLNDDMHAGVIRPRGVNIGNRSLIETKMKGCQFRDCIVGDKDVIFTQKFTRHV